jgi:hypothetical protein
MKVIFEGQDSTHRLRMAGTTMEAKTALRAIARVNKGNLRNLRACNRGGHLRYRRTSMRGVAYPSARLRTS